MGQQGFYRNGIKERPKLIRGEPLEDVQAEEEHEIDLPSQGLKVGQAELQPGSLGSPAVGRPLGGQQETVRFPLLGIDEEDLMDFKVLKEQASYQIQFFIGQLA